MYLYFDRSGALREMINDEALRQYNQNVNTMFVYVESSYINGIHILPSEYDSFSHTYELPDGTSTDTYTGTISGNKVTKTIEFNRRRDLKFFKYGQPYEFIKIEIPSGRRIYDGYEANVLSSYGTVSASIAVKKYSTGSSLSLGLVVFNVEQQVVLPTTNITSSQFQYLLNKIESGGGGGSSNVYFFEGEIEIGDESNEHWVPPSTGNPYYTYTIGQGRYNLVNPKVQSVVVEDGENGYSNASFSYKIYANNNITFFSDSAKPTKFVLIGER